MSYLYPVLFPKIREIIRWTTKGAFRMWTSFSRTKTVAKGYGYCLNSGCPAYHLGLVVFDQPLPWKCFECHQEGRVITEQITDQGRAGMHYAEVRLSFAYCPIEDRYKKVALVRNESLSENSGSYLVQMPTIQDETNAINTAEKILIALNYGGSTTVPYDTAPHVPEKLLHLDQSLPEIKAWLADFQTQLQNHPLFSQRSEQKEEKEATLE